MEPEPSKKIMQKAGSLLARRAYSRGQLRDKLAPLGESGHVESVLDRLEQLGLLNDAEFAYNLASRWIRQEGFGPAKVYHLLRRRQISAAAADAAVERVRREISDHDALADYLARRSRTRQLPADRRAIHKLILSLQRRGFSQEVIWEVLHDAIPVSAWKDFQTGE